MPYNHTRCLGKTFIFEIGELENDETGTRPRDTDYKILTLLFKLYSLQLHFLYSNAHV